MKSAFFSKLPAIALAVTALPALAQTGPGGVVATGASTNLRLWLTAERGAYNTGTTPATNTQSVTQWTDQSGRGTNASNAGTASTRPTFVSAGPNGLPTLNFASASNQTLTSALNINPSSIPNLSVIVVAAATTVNAGTYSKLWGHDDGGFDRAVGIDNRAAGFNYGYFSGPSTGSGVGGLATLTAGSYFISTAVYAGSGGTFSGWHNGSNIVSGASVSNATGSSSLSIGSINASAEHWNGPITEFIAFDKVLSDAERVILHNYLAAKYGLSLAAEDVYTMDNSAAGNYDYDVAGIGLGTTGVSVSSARGTGIVQIGSPSGMTAGEYYIFGHNNAPLTMTGPNRPTGYTSRLTRSWRANESGEVGTVSISFDLNTVSGLPPAASNIVLVVDRDNDGLFSDETVGTGGIVSAASFTGGVASFTGVNLDDQQRFTLAFTNTVALPLELSSFSARAAGAQNEIRWTTANEKGVAGMELERSENGLDFHLLSRHNLTESGSYLAMDEAPTAVAYYRLRILHADGGQSYSATEKVLRRDGASALRISPNPVTNTARLSGLPGTAATIRIFDGSGRQVAQQQTGATAQDISFTALPAGTYLISVDTDGLHEVQQVLKP